MVAGKHPEAWNMPKQACIFLGCMLIALGLAQGARAASPIGHFDIISGHVAGGWSLDPDTANQSLDVHFYLDGPAGQGKFITSIKANRPRPDVNQATGYPGDHGFSLYIPYEYRDGHAHTLYAYGIDLTGDPNFHLISSPKEFNLSFSGTVFPNPGRLWMGPNQHHSFDFKKLFSEPDKWEDARSSVGVFKFYDLYLNPQWEQMWVHSLNHQEDAYKFMNDTELAGAISKLKAWGIETDFESGAVKHWGCTGDITFAQTRISLDRIKSLGGKVRYISMDEPFLGGTSAPPWGCGYSMDKTLDGTINFISMVRSYDPDIVVGDIEPWPHFSKDELEQWIIGFRQKSGYELPFLHMDIDYAHVKIHNANLDDIGEIADFCRARGIKFGIIIWQSDYSHPAPLDSDKVFYDSSMAWASIAHSLGPVDEVVVQSWDPYPKYNLPETSGYSFTQLVRDYANKYPPAIKPRPIDLSGDGRVDSADFEIMVSHWNSGTRPPADINQDGRVDSADLGIMMSWWGL